ncbi:DUF4942 domain-containing protein [Pantoea ananatis]|uniref:DUF4942 domain-containing protein n=1 Tax=Pantoea ananas TaxID=553 RepID=UPI0021E70489|nr:DUF4942 domain-containing protein [Pantoea ananatis]MCW0309715.1 hypothetical protein [Pantoea ananatis]MCW0341510.1 hypothetical protein [Pantoea ananatis]MCW0359955.1 hypothetical protein [Pantoea ananatis]MCW0364618.1 hypothetical protein [Pantoea ananatis]MCW1777094.1 DUF4942 domain-containing protein [Pantoea ananatis]
MTDTTTALTADMHCFEDAGELIPSVPVERIIAQRNSGVEWFMQGMHLIQQAQAAFAQASGREWFYGMKDIIESGLSSARGDKASENLRRQIGRLADRPIWDRLMRDTGMLTLMSAEQKKAWDVELYGEDCPEISFDSVITTFRHLNANKAATFEQGIIDVFRKLSWDYKTNNPCMLGKRVILNGMIDNNANRWFSVRTYGQERLNDLARPFWLLDGKTVPDWRVSEGAHLADFINARSSNLGEVLTCAYFTVRAFKKGSAHVTFTRPDLVEKVNDIVARHYPGALPPAV